MSKILIIIKLGQLDKTIIKCPENSPRPIYINIIHPKSLQPSKISNILQLIYN